jgi:hypothetical protein
MNKQNPQTEAVLNALLKEAKQWYQNGKGRISREEVSAWIDGATASLAIIDHTYTLSNAALEALEKIFKENQ